MDYVFATGGRERYFKGDKVNDCVVRSIANATYWDYKEIYTSLHQFIKSSSRKKVGVSPRNGVRKEHTRKYFEKVLKWTWVPCMGIGGGCKVHLLSNELPKDKIIVVQLSRHLACVRYGKLYDTYDSSRGDTRCVYGYWIVNDSPKPF